MHSLFFALLLSTIAVQARNFEDLHKRAATLSTTSSVPSPTQTGIPCNCNKYYQVASGDSCSGIVAKYNGAFTLNNLYVTKAREAITGKLNTPNTNSYCSSYAWNPAVDTSCGHLFLGYYVCVGVNAAAPSTCISTSAPIASTSSSLSTPTSSASYSILSFSSSSASISSSTASVWPPTATQSGLVSNCNRYYQVRGGDSCAAIRARYSTTITLQDILTWNPALGSDCSNLFVNYWVCVGVPMQTTYVSTPSATSTTSANTTQTFAPWTQNTLPPMDTRSAVPSPTQSGLISNCQGFYAAQDGDNCTSIVQSLSYLTAPMFQSWNPALGTNCAGLISGYYYCIENSTAIRDPPTVTGSPSPTQSGIAPSCSSYYLAPPGLTCDLIVSMFGRFDQSTFFSWNPALNSNCSAIIPGDYYCVGVPGTPTARTSSYSQAPISSMSSQIPVSPPSTSKAVTAGNGTPTPIQSGLVGGCKRFYFIESGDTCYNIAQQAGIVLSDFYTWNPAVKTDCSGLQAHVYVCIGITGTPMTITSGTPIPATPAPVQTAMVSSCARFYKVESGDGCYNMAQQAGIALTDFYAWNPAVKSDCSGLQAGVFVCIGLKGSATTITAGTPVAAVSTSTV